MLKNEAESIKYKKIIFTSMLVGLTVVLSPFSIPVGTARCFPVQHMMNVLIAVILGPSYGVSAAFASSLLRNIFALGTLLAFPGSMVGAFLCGMAFKYTRNIWITCICEIIGTGIIGGLLAYPIATLVIGRKVAVFAFVIPFLISTLGGCIIAIILIKILQKMGVTDFLKNGMKR